MPDFAAKYGASPFDPDDPLDDMAEKARKLLVRSFRKNLRDLDATTGEEVQAIAGGMLVGLVGVMAAHLEPTDENHAALRAGLIQLVPWAVDMVRSIDGRPPLADDRSPETA